MSNFDNIAQVYESQVFAIGTSVLPALAADFIDMIEDTGMFKNDRLPHTLSVVYGDVSLENAQAGSARYPVGISVRADLGDIDVITERYAERLLPGSPVLITDPALVGEY